MRAKCADKATGEAGLASFFTPSCPTIHTLVVAVLTGLMVLVGAQGLFEVWTISPPTWFATLVRCWEWLLLPYLALAGSWLLNVSRNTPGY